MSWMRRIGVVFVAFFFAGAASGSLIVNVDLQPGGPGAGTAVTFSAQGAYASPGTTWNAFAPSTDGSFNGEFGSGGLFDFAGGSSVMSSLLDSTGGTTSVQLELFKGDPDTAFALNPLNGGDVNIADNGKGLMRDFLEATNPNDINITGLTDGGLYTLYLYGATDNSSVQTMFIVAGQTNSTAGVPGGSHNLTLGQDYVVISNVLASGGFIGVNYRPAPSGGGTGAFNGMQIVEQVIPEPSTALLFIVGGLAIAWRKICRAG